MGDRKEQSGEFCITTPTAKPRKRDEELVALRGQVTALTKENEGLRQEYGRSY